MIAIRAANQIPYHGRAGLLFQVNRLHARQQLLEVAVRIGVLLVLLSRHRRWLIRLTNGRISRSIWCNIIAGRAGHFQHRHGQHDDNRELFPIICSKLFRKRNPIKATFLVVRNHVLVCAAGANIDMQALVGNSIEQLGRVQCEQIRETL